MLYEVITLQAKNISEQSLSKDFARNKQIHNCWIITHQAMPTP